MKIKYFLFLFLLTINSLGSSILFGRLLLPSAFAQEAEEEEEVDDDDFADFEDEGGEAEETAETAGTEETEQTSGESSAGFEDLDDLEEFGESELQTETVAEPESVAEPETVAEPEEEAAPELTPAEPSFTPDTVATVPEEPDLNLEQRFHDIYIQFHKEKTSEESWAAAQAGKAVENYTIQIGDTLWGISETLFGDGNFWPKVWSLNQGIRNPHLINPGNRIHFRLGDESDAPAFTITEGDTQGDAETSVEVAETESDEGDEEETVEIPPSSVKVKRPLLKIPPSLPDWIGFGEVSAQYDDAGIDYGRRKISELKTVVPFTSYVSDQIPAHLGKVAEMEVGSRVANALQYIYINMRPGAARVGQKFLVVENLGAIDRSVSSAPGSLGYAIQVQGEITITDRVTGQDEEDTGETFRALVTRILAPVSQGSLVITGRIRSIPLSEGGQIANIPAQITGGELNNVRRVFGAGSIVYLNKGKSSGLAPDDRLAVMANRQQRRPHSKVSAVLQPVGWLKVVDVTQENATAVILKAWAEILAGDITGFGEMGRTEIVRGHNWDPESLGVLEAARAARTEEVTEESPAEAEPAVETVVEPDEEEDDEFADEENLEE